MYYTQFRRDVCITREGEQASMEYQPLVAHMIHDTPRIPYRSFDLIPLDPQQHLYFVELTPSFLQPLESTF
jgi:hypothetical protein